MKTKSIFTSVNYLELLPLNRIAKYTGERLKNGVPFLGYPQQHPADKGKLILVYDPLGKSPAVMEFKLDDILFVEDVPRAVTETGEGVPLVKLWIRKGALGMLLEPFEVDDSFNVADIRREKKERFSKKRKKGKE